MRPRAPWTGSAPAPTRRQVGARGGAGPAFDPNEEVVLPPYLRGTLALLAALPADRPVGPAELARAVGGRTAAWDRFLGQLTERRLADDVGLDGRPLLLATPAGLILREQVCRPSGNARAAKAALSLLDRLGLERVALLEAIAQLGPLSLADVLAACRCLPGHLREPAPARSAFLAMTRRHRLIEPVPGDESLDPARRRYRAADAAWRIVAARRRLHPSAYDLGPFAARLAAMRAEARPALVGRGPRRRPARAAPSGQLRLL